MPNPAVIHIFSHISDSDAVITADFTGALTAHGLLFAAGTFRNAEFIVHIQPAGNMFHWDGRVFHRDRLFHRNDMHPDTGAARRHHFRDPC